jgi:hypothetical protein
MVPDPVSFLFRMKIPVVFSIDGKVYFHFYFPATGHFRPYRYRNPRSGCIVSDRTIVMQDNPGKSDS